MIPSYVLPALFLTACGPSGGSASDYTINLEPVVATNQPDLFDALDRLDLIFDAPGDDDLRVALGAPTSGSTLDAEALPPLADTIVRVEGYAAGERVAWGQTLPLSAEDGVVDVQVYVGRASDAAWLGARPDGLLQTGLIATGDGRFLVFGGVANGRNDLPTQVQDTYAALTLAPPGDGLAFEELGALPEHTTTAGDASTQRAWAAATRLSVAGSDAGKILYFGGSSEDPYGGGLAVTSTSHLYDPATDAWEVLEARAQLTTPRARHLAIENSVGNVVVWGGFAETDQANTYGWVDTFEMYDRAGRAFAEIGQASALGQIEAAAANLGTTGTLVCGGAELQGGSPEFWASMDGCVRVANDGSSLTAVASLPERLSGLAMVELPDGRALASGGATRAAHADGGEAARTEAWVYEPDTDAWSFVGDMNVARAGHRLAALPDGRVLVVGGASTHDPFALTTDALSCLELFDPSTSAFTVLGGCDETSDSVGLPGRSNGPAVAVDPVWGALIVGGSDGAGKAQSAVSLFLPE